MLFAGIVAGGIGSRISHSIPKQYIKINGKTILEITLEKFITFKQFEKIYIGVNKKHQKYIEEILEKINDKRLEVVYGGIERYETLYNITKKIDSEYSGKNFLVSHDAVRPLVSNRIISDHIDNIIYNSTLTTAVKTIDTIVEADDELVNKCLNRTKLYNCQTPQSFEVKEYLHLMDNLDKNEKTRITDICSLMSKFNKKVGIIDGDYKNIKITTDMDLEILRMYLSFEK